MNLTKNFTLEEFCKSDIALKNGLNNTITDSGLMEAAMRTCVMMENVRTALSLQAGKDIPITVLSGYRTVLLNRLVQGATLVSDHSKGAAMDWVAPLFGDTTAIARLLVPKMSVLGIGQLILEHPGTHNSWIHCSTITPMSATNRVLTCTDTGYRPGIWEA
ncbi:MAG: D-Ala-D-Ala carboxypeptidase family metallohydrolase [Leptothrix sp. (in: b-proteobacteria)]